MTKISARGVCQKAEARFDPVMRMRIRKTGPLFSGYSCCFLWDGLKVGTFVLYGICVTSELFSQWMEVGLKLNLDGKGWQKSRPTVRP